MRNPFKRKINPAPKGTENGNGNRVQEPLSSNQILFRVALGFVLIFGITFLYPIDKIYEPIQIPVIGEIAERDIIAPFDFPILKSDEELQKDRESVLANLRPVLSYDVAIAENARERIRRLFSTADSLNALKLDSLAFLQIMRSNYPNLSENTINSLHDTRAAHALAEFAIPVLDTLMFDGIYPSLVNLPLEESGIVIVDKRGETKTVVREQIFDLDKAHWYVTVQADAALSRRPALRPAGREIGWQFLEPNLVFDKSLTESSKNSELTGIRAEKGWVYKDQKIVRANERITKLIRDKLLSLARYKRTKLIQSDVVQFLLPPLGRLFFVAFPILFFAFYLHHFRRNIFASNSALILFAILLAGLGDDSRYRQFPGLSLALSGSYYYRRHAVYNRIRSRDRYLPELYRRDAYRNPFRL